MNLAHAVAFGSDGRAYVDQITDFKNGNLWTSSQAPLSESTTIDSKQHSITRYICVNGTGTSLPYSISCVDFSLRWNWREIDTQLYKNGENVSFKPFSNGLQNVDTFGFGNKRVFRFREVTGLDETLKLSEELASGVLSADKVQKYVDEAIYLKGLNVNLDQSELKTDPVPAGFVGLVRFYWLSDTDQKLHYISQEQVQHNIVPSAVGRNLLITYPIHPNAAAHKIHATASLLQERFEATLGRSFDAVHISKIPLVIDEPDTLQSNFPTRDEIRF